MDVTHSPTLTDNINDRLTLAPFNFVWIILFSRRKRCQRVKLCRTSLIIFFSKPDLISTEEIQVEQHCVICCKNQLRSNDLSLEAAKLITALFFIVL